MHDLRPEINARCEILDAARKTAESEERFRVLASSMPQFVWTADTNGKLTYFNQAFLEFTGLTEEESLGDGWPVIVHPDDREENIRIWKTAVENAHDYTFHQRFRSKEGEYRWQLSRAVPLRNNKGEILQWLGTSTDIDEQKKMADELERMVRERTAALSESHLNLERTNRELEQFAYVASHDLQEPLRKIRIFSEMLGVTLPAGDTSAQTYLHKINLAAARMSALIKDLLNFSQLPGDYSQFKNTDLNSVLNDVEGDFELLIHQKNAVIMAEPLPIVEAIPLQVNQLFYNLLGNSLKFIAEDRKSLIFITSRLIHGVEDELWPGLDHARKYYEIIFRDNGIGFSQEYAAQIFTIFQRLNNRDSFDGTGIGLAICKKIALNHHGDIKAFSADGEGASFHILLPEKQPFAGTR
jgi:PAS domain S-box-containing protein